MSDDVLGKLRDGPGDLGGDRHEEVDQRRLNLDLPGVPGAPDAARPDLPYADLLERSHRQPLAHPQGRRGVPHGQQVGRHGAQPHGDRRGPVARPGETAEAEGEGVDTLDA